MSLVFLVAPAAAATPTLYVTKTTDTNDGVCDIDCSLREAITQANADNNASTIVVPDGHFVLSITGQDEDNNATGDLDIRAGMTIVGDGARRTIIDGKKIDRVFNAPYTGTTQPFEVWIADLTVTGGEIDDALGGGMWMQDPMGTYYLVDSTVRGNHGNQAGGVANGYQWATTMYITRSTISGNSAAGEGGAIVNDGTLTISNSTIANNTTQGLGGGLVDYTGTVTIQWSTIAFNKSAEGGGLATNGEPVYVSHSIVAKNTASSGYGKNCGPGITSNGRNLENGTTCNFNRPNDKNAKPLIDPLGNYGGPTNTVRLQAGSPAINAGGQNYPATDQRGFGRPHGGGADIGSYER